MPPSSAGTRTSRRCSRDRRRLCGQPRPKARSSRIAELGGRRVGCIFCVADPDDPTTAQLRILLVHPEGRGHGLGGRLVDTCLRFARTAGYARIRLWTNDPLKAARRIYLSRGFTLTAEEPHHSFGVDLIGETYETQPRRRRGRVSRRTRKAHLASRPPPTNTAPRLPCATGGRRRAD